MKAVLFLAIALAVSSVVT
jgi:hypothetical protein